MRYLPSKAVISWILNRNLIARLSGNLCKIPFSSRSQGHKGEATRAKASKLVNPQKNLFSYPMWKLEKKHQKMFRRSEKSAHSIVHYPCARRSSSSSIGLECSSALKSIENHSKRREKIEGEKWLINLFY